MTRRPATHNRILDSRTRQPADALIRVLEHRLNANISRSSCPYLRAIFGRHHPLTVVEAKLAQSRLGDKKRQKAAMNLSQFVALTCRYLPPFVTSDSTQLNAIQHISTSQLRVNRPLIVWLAARRQGPPRCAAVHLDDARFAKDRWRLRLHAGSVTVVIIWHETPCAGGIQPAAHHARRGNLLIALLFGLFFCRWQRGQLDALISAAFLIFRVRFNGQHRDVSLVRPVSPKHPSG